MKTLVYHSTSFCSIDTHNFQLFLEREVPPTWGHYHWKACAHVLFQRFTDFLIPTSTPTPTPTPTQTPTTAQTLIKTQNIWTHSLFDSMAKGPPTWRQGSLKNYIAALNVAQSPRCDELLVSAKPNWSDFPPWFCLPMISMIWILTLAKNQNHTSKLQKPKCTKLGQVSQIWRGKTTRITLRR